MLDKLFQFIRDKFEVLLLFSLVLIILSIWMRSDYSPTVKEVLMFVLGAMTALMRIVPRPNQNIQTDNVNAENIETAKTQTGDIIGTPGSELIKGADTETAKETQEQ